MQTPCCFAFLLKKSCLLIGPPIQLLTSPTPLYCMYFNCVHVFMIHVCIIRKIWLPLSLFYSFHLFHMCLLLWVHVHMILGGLNITTLKSLFTSPREIITSSSIGRVHTRVRGKVQIFKRQFLVFWIAATITATGENQQNFCLSKSFCALEPHSTITVLLSAWFAEICCHDECTWIQIALTSLMPREGESAV